MMLLNWRVWAAITLAVVLAGSHWKAYTSGEKVVQAEWNAEKLEQEQAALAASEANRVKEKALNLSKERISNELIKEKAARAADSVATAGRLRDLEAALDSVASSDTSATCRADDPALTIAHQCARSLVLLDEYAKGLASQTRGLQDYAVNVCMTK